MWINALLRLIKGLISVVRLPEHYGPNAVVVYAKLDGTLFDDVSFVAPCQKIQQQLMEKHGCTAGWKQPSRRNEVSAAVSWSSP